MLVEILNETVKVRADFQGGVITPLAFKHNGRTLHVERINARWEDRETRFKRWFFSVRAEGAVYELHLDSADMTWHLSRVCLE
jgi:hypothetical protein